jgi:uncharacterized protein YwgA
LESRSLTVPSEYRYVVAEYHPESSERTVSIGVIIQSKQELLFRFISPNEAGDLIPELSRDLIFNIEVTFIRDREKGSVPIPRREGNERELIPVTSSGYLDYLRSTFLNTITFTAPKAIIAARGDALLTSLFEEHVLQPTLATVSAQLKVESLTDGLLLLLYARSNEPVAGSTKLQKLTYVLKEETRLGKRLKDEFAYVPHHFGPYSSDLTSMLDVLQQEGLIEIKEVSQLDAKAEIDRRDIQKSEQDLAVPEKRWTMRVYKLTPDGVKLARALAESVPQSELEEVIRLKEKFNSIPTRNIIDYVYKRYERMTTKSKLKKRAEKGRYYC